MKKILYLSMIFVLVFTFTLGQNVEALVAMPRISIGTPSSGVVQVGGTISYTIKIYNATSVNLKPSDIRIAGVTANISVSGSGNSERTVTLSNIQGSVGSTGYICYVASGVATNERGGNYQVESSTPFTIIATPTPPQPQTPTQPQQPNNPTLPPQTNQTPNNNSGGNNNNNNNNNNTNNENPTPEEQNDTEAPKMIIDGFSSQSIGRGDEISFKVKYEDNKEMGEITLNENDLKLFGFTAEIEIKGDGNERTITLKNIQGDLGGHKYVLIAGNTAKDKAGNTVSEGGKTGMFKLITSDTKNNPDDWIENPNTGK